MKERTNKFLRYFVPVFAFFILGWVFIQSLSSFFTKILPSPLVDIVALTTLVIDTLFPVLVLACGLINILIDGNKILSFIILTLGVFCVVYWIQIFFSTELL
ncbi:hypothetical protein A2115_01130 [Candidatus Woesebacteria bacterium GWA1_41_8]|jgi:hypothetical protein|uniref:Uncharacterized protein n=1 Tax=Candidatus Woesebacteria bacterium GWA1_41_8 TaxID=1802471 RepID=A0A1F7WIG4_9BACT|nr:MAG: hypothetical protein A2115_01130 [Candidatus Woesebacteria bacterium GWA1_41_8]